MNLFDKKYTQLLVKSVVFLSFVTGLLVFMIGVSVHARMVLYGVMGFFFGLFWKDIKRIL